MDVKSLKGNKYDELNLNFEITNDSDHRSEDEREGQKKDRMKRSDE